MGLGGLIRRLRGPSEEELRDLRAYVDGVSPRLDRVLAILDDWNSFAEYESDDAKRANRASVYRWEVLRLRSALEEMPAAPRVVGTHRAVLAGLEEVARGFQALATGHRFHRYAAVCDGQTAITAGRERVAGARQRLRSVVAAPAAHEV